MKIGILENDKLYIEYNPDIGGSIFKFQAKLHNQKYDIFRRFNKRVGKAKSLLIFVEILFVNTLRNFLGVI